MENLHIDIDQIFGPARNIVSKAKKPFELKIIHYVAGGILLYLLYKGVEVTINENIRRNGVKLKSTKK
jgi:hypothetical protein